MLLVQCMFCWPSCFSTARSGLTSGCMANTLLHHITIPITSCHASSTSIQSCTCSYVISWKKDGKHGHELHTCFIFHLSNWQSLNSVRDGQPPFKEGAGSAQCQGRQEQPQDNKDDQVFIHIMCICWSCQVVSCKAMSLKLLSVEQFSHNNKCLYCTDMVHVIQHFCVECPAVQHFFDFCWRNYPVRMGY